MMTSPAVTTLTVRGPFSLAESAGFLGRMAHLSSSSGATGLDDHLHLAFVPDGRPEGAVGVCVRQPSPQRVELQLTGTVDDHDRVVEQVARILSIDVDGRAYEAIGAADPLVGSRQAQRPGFRPVTFASPYEAAAHFLMSQRISMRQAAAIKQRLADEVGERVEVCGEELAAFPGPARLRQLHQIRGLTERKVEWLHAIADAAITTDLLDGAAIRSISAADAVAGLESLPGVGPFTSSGVVVRGAGAPDVLTLHEPRVRRAVAELYHVDEPLTDERFLGIAEAWRPFRSWVTVLIRATSVD
jgi:DNA-3-methyladenine glycosylase II